METLAKDFEDIILAPEDKERILQLALATRNTKRSAAPYRHVLSAFDDVGMLDAELKTFIDEECLTNDAMEELLSLTKGFSGREISKLFISVQYVLLFG